MNGPDMLYVNRLSATRASHTRGEERSEFTLAIEEDHSNLVKFTPGNEHYGRLVRIIHTCLVVLSKFEKLNI